MKRWLAHWFSPRKSNRHHAKLLHADSLAFLVAFVVLGHTTLALKYNLPLIPFLPNILGQETRLNQQSIFDAINAERVAADLPPLVWNDTLATAAQAKAQDMLQNDYWSHTSPSGRTPWTFIDNTPYQYQIAGENLARNFTSTPAVIQAWMGSTTHRANILHDDYVDTGIAVVPGVMDGKQTTLVVQFFATPTAPIAGDIALPIPAFATSRGVSALTADIPSRDVLGTQLRVNAIGLYRVGTLLMLATIVGVLVHDQLHVVRGTIRRRKQQNWAHLALFVVVVMTFALAESGSLL